MADVADKLDGIIDDLSGLEYGLELCALILVHQVFIQIQAGGGKQWSCVIMQVGGQALAFFFLQFDRSVEQDLLLLLFHLLQFILKADNASLMEYDKDHQADGQHKHPQGA